MMAKRPLAVLAGAALALGPALPAAATHDVTPARIGGETRYSTAAEIALQDHPDGSDEVIVALGENYPDALAGAPVAAELDAPILLTRQDELPDSTLSALSELDPSHVTILGGPVAVSDEVEATIAQSLRVETDRIEGDTRYETAAAAATFVQERNDNAGNFPGGQRAVFLTTGENFPDALTAGAPAASRQEAPIPIMLTRPDELPTTTAATIDELAIELVVIVGGPTAVSDDVENAVEDDDTTVVRVEGDTRTATAAAMADFALENFDFTPADLELARGDLYPDALSVAPQAGADGNPILLTRDRDTLSDATHAWLSEQCESVERIRAIGLEVAITTATLEAAEQAAEACHREGTEQNVLVTPQQHIEATPGDAREIEAVTRHDEAADTLTEPLDVWLFPCDSVLEPSDGDFRFADEDDNGMADGIQSTNTDAAVITTINGEATDGVKGERDVAPNADGHIQVTVESDAVDCAAVVFFDDANNDSSLNVDADGLPTEDWGFTTIEWAG